jgi:hypothetical protein
MFSKSVIGAALFAIALWAYTNLNYTYTTYVKVPLELSVPNDRAIDSMPVSDVSLQVRGNGWNLFNLIFFNTAARCHVNLSEEQSALDGKYMLTRSELLKNVKFLNNVEAIDILPETIRIKTGDVDSKRVPIRVNMDIQPRRNFSRTGSFIIDPDSVTITGNTKVVEEIDYWPTKFMTIDDVHQRLRIVANLSDSLPEIIDVSPQKVTVGFDVQQLASMKFPDVKVSIKGGALPSNHILQPRIISITVRGGIELIEQLSYDDIKAGVDYRAVIEDTTGIIEPDILLPEGIEIMRIEPDIIYHYRNDATLNRLNL